MKNRGEFHDYWMISEYPAEFFIYKIFNNISFDDLKTTCKTNNATMWDIQANQLNQMPSTWETNTILHGHSKTERSSPRNTH